MVGWDYQLKEREFVQTPGDGEGQGNLACCSPWDCKESDMTQQQNIKCSPKISSLLECSAWTAGLRVWLVLAEIPSLKVE